MTEKQITRDERGNCKKCGKPIYMRRWLTKPADNKTPGFWTERLYHIETEAALCFPLWCATEE